jgi:hypothetical protein
MFARPRRARKPSGKHDRRFVTTNSMDASTSMALGKRGPTGQESGAMPRQRLALAALAIAAASAVTTTTTAVRAGVGPGCEAGVPCADDDGDGFMACACAPPGTACDCDDGDPNAFPGAPERCDATKDLNCNKVVPEPCGEKAGCFKGTCVPECIPLDDFGCGIGNRCESQPNGQRLCAGPDCSAFGCPVGATCDETKVCVANCNANVKCPFGQRCRGSGCVDPCDGVVCGPGASCQNGRCLPSCDCFPGSTGCVAGEACDRSTSVARCVEQGCEGVVCADGTHCAAGKCVDDCAGVVCPPKRVCEHVGSDGGTTRGQCVDLCPPGICAKPMVCDWRTGTCLLPDFPEAGLQPVATGGEDDLLFVGGAGITCTTNGLARVSATGGIAAALSFVLLLARRARRRR